MLLRLLGIQPVQGEDIHSEEELKMIISESHEGGLLSKQKEI
jgi:Domain of unknown function DUF21.